jgi:predicted O-methyltransferase YrrM
VPRRLDGVLHPMDERIARTLVRLIKGVAFRTHERQMQFFDLAQRHGLHVLKNHFYSPVPDTSQIDRTIWQRRADHDGGFDLRQEAELELLTELRTYAHELDDVQGESDEPTQFAWNNPAFWPGDAAAYYCMIRHTGAKRVLEVGSGYSTRIAARAALLNGAELTSIEPYPLEFLQIELPGFSRLIKSPVQDVPFEVFEALEKNDILFIDSTHVSKIGSDVNHLLLRVIPRLKPGVVIHVHDIFLPWEPPHGWVVDKKIFWNEQYMLQALLTCNPSFEVLLANQFLGRLHPDAFRAGFPCIPQRFAPGGVSFWFRRLAT